MILVIGVELAKSSLHKILNPAPVAFSWLMLAVLVGSILVKAWMMFFYKKQGKKINSTTLLAAAEDSRNDVLTTAAVLAAVLVEKLSGWQIDGIMGILVAVFILFSGAKLAKETLSPLLGEGATKELAQQVTAYIKSFPLVLGCHDLMVHDYGPGCRYASLHVELDSREDPMACHELIDDMERGCLKELGIHLVIHYDPLLTDDAELNRLQQLVEDASESAGPEHQHPRLPPAPPGGPAGPELRHRPAPQALGPGGQHPGLAGASPGQTGGQALSPGRDLRSGGCLPGRLII